MTASVYSISRTFQSVDSRERKWWFIILEFIVKDRSSFKTRIRDLMLLRDMFEYVDVTD